VTGNTVAFVDVDGDESQVAVAVAETAAAAAALPAAVETVETVETAAAALPVVLPVPRNVAPGGGGIDGEVVRVEEPIITWVLA